MRAEYAIDYNGRWQAVWRRPMAEIDELLLESLTEAHFGEALCESEKMRAPAQNRGPIATNVLPQDHGIQENKATSCTYTPHCDGQQAFINSL